MFGDIEVSVTIVNAAAVKALQDALQIVNDLADAQPWNSDLQELRALLTEAANGLDIAK